MTAGRIRKDGWQEENMRNLAGIKKYSEGTGRKKQVEWAGRKIR